MGRDGETGQSTYLTTQQCLRSLIARQPAEKQPAAIVGHNNRAQGTGKNGWYTPGQYVEAARQVLGTIALDPVSSSIANETVRVKHVSRVCTLVFIY